MVVFRENQPSKFTDSVVDESIGRFIKDKMSKLSWSGEQYHHRLDVPLA